MGYERWGQEITQWLMGRPTWRPFCVSLRCACFIREVFFLVKSKASSLGITQVLDYQDFQIIGYLIKGIWLYHNLVQNSLSFCHVTIPTCFMRSEDLLECISVCELWDLLKKLTISRWPLLTRHPVLFQLITSINSPNFLVGHLIVYNKLN
jgi:hypothetical protein